MRQRDDRTTEIKKGIDEAIICHDYSAIFEGYQELAHINLEQAQEDMALNALYMSEAIVKKYDLGLRKHMQVLFMEIEIYFERSDEHYAGYKLKQIEKQCLESGDEELIKTYNELKTLVIHKSGYEKVC